MVRRVRRTISLVSTVCLLVALVATSDTALADAPPDPVQAAKEITAARDRANQAGQAYLDQEARIAELDESQTQLQTSVDALTKRVEALKEKLGVIAVNRYVSSGSADTLAVLSGFDSLDDQVQMDALLDVIKSTSADDFDLFRSMNADLERQRSALQVSEVTAQAESDRLAQLKATALAEVDQLKTVQADLLDDEAVRKALIAEAAERDRAAQQAQAATSTTSTSGSSANGGTVAASGAAGGQSGPALGANADDSGGATPVTRPAGSGVVGGTTGQGGSGLGVPPAIGGIGGDYGGADWVCPTGTSAVAFSDTWGAPRQNGRRHQGVDMIGPRGTPLLAVVDGVAVGKPNVLGGTTISFTGNDGNRYYYAHLDSYVTLGEVKAGTVIGLMGQTGDAQYSVPHLHFEIHPGGGAAVDPYPTVRAHCGGA